jgi:hypothetical protein
MPEPGEGAWGPETCGRCTGPLPRGLVALGRGDHVNCEEARQAWQEMAARGKTPGVRR